MLLWDNEWKKLLRTILDEGQDVKRESNPKRNIREIVGYSFKLEQPLDRLLCDEVRGLNIFQCVGQFLWTTQGNFNLENIRYYQPRTEELSSDGIKMIGAYGPRLFGIQHLNQIENLIKVLIKEPTKRRAVASIYLPQFDQHEKSKEEVPCTLNLQYLIRENHLQSITYMRSQDVFNVLPYDIFLFTMLQEYILNRLRPEFKDFKLGTYNHFSGSFHVYEKDIPEIEKILENTTTCDEKMSAMPNKDAEIELKNLNKFEAALRTRTTTKILYDVDVNYPGMFDLLNKLQKDEYWTQLGLILIAYSAIWTKNTTVLKEATEKLNPTFQNLVKIYQEKNPLDSKRVFS